MEDKLKRPRHTIVGQVGLQVATGLIALRIGLRALRAVGKVLLPPGASKRVAPEPQRSLESLEDATAHASTARDQWVLCTDSLPTLPADAKLVASADLPISVYTFYEQFLSIDTSCLQDHHKSAGHEKFTSTRWKLDSTNGLTRVFRFVQPKKGVISVPANCVQRQRLSVHAGGVLSLTTDMQPSGIPCADNFRVVSYWTVRPTRHGSSCHVEIRVAVPWTGWGLHPLRPTITKTSIGDCRSFFSDFLEKVELTASEIGTGQAGAAPAPGVAVSPFAGRAGGPENPEPRPELPARRTLSVAAKASFLQASPSHLLEPPARRPGPVGGLWLSTRQMVHVHTLLLAVVLLLQAALLWELFVLQQQLAAAGVAPGVASEASLFGSGGLDALRERLAAWLAAWLGPSLVNGAGRDQSGASGGGSGIVMGDAAAAAAATT